MGLQFSVTAGAVTMAGMCYSAQIKADYLRYTRAYGAALSLPAFYDLFWRRRNQRSIKIPKLLESVFADPQSTEERSILEAIEGYRVDEAGRLEVELFKQRKRLADAERVLLTKTTKAAAESQRIATDKIASTRRRLEDLRRSEMLDRDARIFPGYYAPVIVSEGGKRVVKPMRYQCRPAGKPAFYDTKYPGTYNARRDSLGGFWKAQFGYTHGLMVVSAFYENVSRHAMEGRGLTEGEAPQNVVLEFKPRPPQDMLVACLWSRWTGPGEDLLSFAAITDEPPPEVAAAGHDRCIVPIKPEHIDAWLNPDAAKLEALQAILDDRPQPYYEHRMAA